MSTDVVGFIAWLGTSYNAITFTCLVMSIGFCVDYSVHVVHFFKHGAQGSAAANAQHSLFMCGPEVLHGATTTLLGVGVLALGQSEGFRIFAQMTAAVVVYGVLHGLVLLPVLLSVGRSSAAGTCGSGTQVEALAHEPAAAAPGGGAATAP